MNDKLYEILMNLNRGRITVSESYDQAISAMSSNAVLADRCRMKKGEV